MPPSGAPGHLDWTKLAQCTTRSYILQNKTIIRPLRHILRFFFRLSPPLGPHGGTCTTTPWGQQHETITGSLWYLVTEEIEEQDIVYGQTARWRTNRYCISLTGLWLVELKMTWRRCFTFSLCSISLFVGNLIGTYHCVYFSLRAI